MNTYAATAAAATLHSTAPVRSSFAHILASLAPSLTPGNPRCSGGNEQEKQERYKGLNTAEKVTLHTGRFFLANKYSRTFIFFYALALHLLVFLTLYKLANTATLRPAAV
jgi:hypothetical protein